MLCRMNGRSPKAFDFSLFLSRFRRGTRFLFLIQFFFLLSQSRASAGNDLPCNLIWVPSGVKSSINSAVHSLAGTEREGIIIYCLLQSTSAAEFKLKKNFFALLFCCCSFSFMFIVPTFEFCKSIKGDVDRNVMPLRSVLISGFRGCI